MKYKMNENEKSLIEALTTLAIWILFAVALYVEFVSGMISSTAAIIVSDSKLCLMVLTLIVGGIIMALGYDCYIITKQNIAYQKAKKFVEVEDEVSNEEIVE